MNLLNVFFSRLWLLAVASQHLGTWKALAQGKPCEDQLPDCSDYLNNDECETYSGLTRQYCAKSCNYCTTAPPLGSVCQDLLSDCAVYIESSSQCHQAKDFFMKYCPRTCGYCSCYDILPECASFITSPEECRTSAFLTKYCRMSCSLCATQSSSTPSPKTMSTQSTPAPNFSSIGITPTLKTTSIKPSATTLPSLTTAVTTTPRTTRKPTTDNILPTGPIGCADVNPEQCASIVADDPQSCRNSDRREYMETNCPETCKLCDVDLYCEDKMPKECRDLITKDKEYCKTKPEFMKENCASTCGYCGCTDVLEICSSLVENNKDYCFSNRLFMKTNCPKSCDLCNETRNASRNTEANVDVLPPAPPFRDCVDKRRRCQMFAAKRNYCTYQRRFMNRNCPKACQFCEKEYNFSINSEWNGAPINHAPIVFQISAQDSRNVLVSVSGPFFNDPGPPPCAAGSACDGLWNYEVAEVFFLGKNEKYLEVELSPHGQHLLLLLNGVRKPFLDKVPIEYTAKIDRTKNTWNGTAIIPIDYLPPHVGRINAYAIHGSGVNRRYESLYPASADVSDPDFHRLEFFKPFDFKAMFSLSWEKPKSPFWKNSIRRMMRSRARI